VPLSPRARFLIGASGVLCLMSAGPGSGQQPASQLPQAPVQQPSQAPAAKKPPAGPAAPQSTHYPILLLVQGSAPVPQQSPSESSLPTDGNPTSPQAPIVSWSLRIGLKGPERFDRVGYPPIPLDPAEVVREGTTDSWTYHAKDSQTGAAVSVHIAREACTDAASGTKFIFSGSVEHAQVGSVQGCARVATELFPKINNQPTDEDEAAKDKPAPPTITKFKPPVAVAHNAPGAKVIFKRGTVARTVPGKESYQFCLSHDGKKLLYVSEEKGGERTIFLYDWGTAKSSAVFQGTIQQPFWSPDDTRIAFLKFDTKWQVWTMPSDAPEKAALLDPEEEVSLEGWVDAHTLLAQGSQALNWIGDDGSVKQSVSNAELYGRDQFGLSSASTVRVSPINPDLLLVSTEWLKPPQGVPVDPHIGGGMGFYLYEVRSKRRVILCPMDLFSQNAEWSRDSLQIFFTGWQVPGGPTTIYKMFWDGTSQLKYQEGSNLVIGQ
jgi:uncharacterized membrane protein